MVRPVVDSGQELWLDREVQDVAFPALGRPVVNQRYCHSSCDHYHCTKAVFPGTCDWGLHCSVQQESGRAVIVRKGYDFLVDQTVVLQRHWDQSRFQVLIE
jgi:hypothetical protein